jgi:hypothetical protein
MQEKWGTAIHSFPQVYREYLEPSSAVAREPDFNSDFVIDFVDDFTVLPDWEGTMQTALPNTFGTDLYLFVQTSSLMPLRFEMMFGKAFSIGDFAEYIERVESTVIDAVTSLSTVDKVFKQELLQQASIAKSRCARVLVVGGDICFLYFPCEDMPVRRGGQFDLATDNDRRIACYLTGDDVVCFDGWIRTDVVVGDQTLVVQPVVKL